MKNSINHLKRIPGLIAIGLVNIYQMTVSPDHGLFKGKYPHGYCRHYPTCSEYAKLAIEKYGFVKGVILATGRIIRCNPWAQPSIDQP